MEMKNLRLWVNHIIIAGLDVAIRFSETDIELTLPESHNKFLQPEDGIQAVSQFGINHRSLIIDFVNEAPAEDSAVDYAYRSDTWEFGRASDGNLIFNYPSEEPRSTLVINPDFSRGKLTGEFSKINEGKVYPLQWLEIQMCSAWLATMGDVILHASGVAREGKGYCFIGESGAGKSTIAAALAGDPAVTVLGEDQVILRWLDGRFWIFGTPWHINPAMCSPLGVPLEKLYFLDRSMPDGVTQMEPDLGVTRILQIAFVPYYFTEHLPTILDRLSLLAKQIPFNSLSYRLGSDPWQLIRSSS